MLVRRLRDSLELTNRSCNEWLIESLSSRSSSNLLKKNVAVSHTAVHQASSASSLKNFPEGCTRSAFESGILASIAGVRAPCSAVLEPLIEDMSVAQ